MHTPETRARAYAKIKQRREQWFKENGPCVRCASIEDLEVDHIDPALKVSHCVWSWSEERRTAELAKCQVLCKKCHTEKTAIENSKEITHGTRGGYARGCRCELCFQHQKHRMQQYHKISRCSSSGRAPAL